MLFFSIYCNDGRILYSTRISWDVPHVNTLYKLIFLTQKNRIFTGINFYRSLSLRQNTCLFLNSIIEKNCKNQETIWNESSTNHCHRWFHSQIFAGWRPKIVIFFFPHRLLIFASVVAGLSRKMMYANAEKSARSHDGMLHHNIFWYRCKYDISASVSYK